ncbi:hypothetical protein D3C75_1233630 [compost metagenome]
MGDDLRVGTFQCQRHAGKQTAAGQRHQHLGDVWLLLKDLQPQRALPGDDRRMIERRQQCRAMFTGNPLGLTLGIILGLADDADFGA